MGGRQAKWKNWRVIALVPLWQAVALSLDIEPDKVRRGTIGDGSREWNEGDKFCERMSIAEKVIDGPRGIPSRGSSVGGKLKDILVDLSAFARWCESAKWPIPPELAELARIGDMPAAQSAVGPSRAVLIRGARADTRVAVQFADPTRLLKAAHAVVVEFWAAGKRPSQTDVVKWLVTNQNLSSTEGLTVDRVTRPDDLRDAHRLGKAKPPSKKKQASSGL
jgi:hypothetical protein